jgi:hypothetical protein
MARNLCALCCFGMPGGDEKHCGCIRCPAAGRRLGGGCGSGFRARLRRREDERLYAAAGGQTAATGPGVGTRCGRLLRRTAGPGVSASPPRCGPGSPTAERRRIRGGRRREGSPAGVTQACKSAHASCDSPSRSATRHARTADMGDREVYQDHRVDHSDRLTWAPPLDPQCGLWPIRTQ